jgi:deazaflavin-dependent oxidoreductase (nitroreductase family)
LVRLGLRLPVLLYRAGLGRLLGHRFLLLRHRGRRTGRLHDTVLEVVRYERAADESVVASGFGRSADWYRNLRSSPAAEILTAGDRYQPTVRWLATEEAVDVIADYESRNRWMRPLVRFVMSKLAGFPYDGSAASRRRLVEVMPLIAFRPVSGGAHPGEGL